MISTIIDLCGYVAGAGLMLSILIATWTIPVLAYLIYTGKLKQVTISQHMPPHTRSWRHMFQNRVIKESK